MLKEILENIEVNEAIIRPEAKVRKDKDTGLLVAEWIFNAYSEDVLDGIRDHIKQKSTLIWRRNKGGYTTFKVELSDYKQLLKDIPKNTDMYGIWPEFTDLQRDIILSLQLRA